MGLSGSGKSSLLRCINGLNTVSRGKLFVEHEGKQIDIAPAPRRAENDAHQAHRHGVPEVRPDALADGAREHQLRPGNAGPPGKNGASWWTTSSSWWA
jgi:energy-coupling factor transporter ATP-binding protein EcfA2